MLNKIRDVLKNKEHRLSVPRVRARSVPAKPQPPQPVRTPPPVVEPFTGITTETAPPAPRAADAIRVKADHAGHLGLLTRSDDEAAKLSVDALAASRHRVTILYGAADEVSGYMTGESMLDVMTITRNGETATAYPVVKAGRPRPARVLRTTEREDGLEGQIEVFAGGGTLSFFDTMYFRNKGLYTPGRDVNVLLAGFAYVTARCRGAGPHEDDLVVHYEDGDLDDYVFRGTAQDVTEFMALGRKAWAIRTTLRPGHEGEPRDFYVCATSSAMQEKIRPGDRFSAILWLQGFVVP